MNIEFPVANVAKNSPPTSVYQQCNQLIQVIWSLSNHHEINKNMENGYDFRKALFPNGTENVEGSKKDPVTILWDFCALGSSLCAIINLFKDSEKIKIIEIEPERPIDETMKMRKKSVFLFIKSCKDTFNMTDGELFNISDVFRDNTNYFVKVVKTLNNVIEKLKEKEGLPKELIPLPESLGITELNVAKPTDYRAQQIKEILETERSYVRDLELIRTYKNEAQYEGVILKDKAEKIFPEFDDLVEKQRRFLIDLESELALPVKKQRIGNLFLMHRETFVVYEAYCSNQEKVSEMIEKEADYYVESWSKTYAKFNGLPEGTIVSQNNQISSYLIKPVQRICKYPLLLERLYKHDKKENHPYAEELLQGLEVIKSIVHNINEAKRIYENNKKVFELYKNEIDWKNLKVSIDQIIKGAKSENGRKGYDPSLDDMVINEKNFNSIIFESSRVFGNLILTEQFEVSSPDDGDKLLYIYLFEKVLLSFKESTKAKKSKMALILNNNLFTTFITGVEDISIPEQMKFQFKIEIKKSDGFISYIFKTKKGLDLVQRWVEAIRDIKTKRSQQQDNAFSNNTKLFHNYSIQNQDEQRINNEINMAQVQRSNYERNAIQMQRVNNTPLNNYYNYNSVNPQQYSPQQYNPQQYQYDPYDEEFPEEQLNMRKMDEANYMPFLQGNSYSKALPKQKPVPFRSSSFTRNESQENNSSLSQSYSSTASNSYYSVGNEPRNSQYDIYSNDNYYDDSFLDDYFGYESDPEDKYIPESISSNSYNQYHPGSSTSQYQQQQYSNNTAAQNYYSHSRSNSNQYSNQSSRNSSYPELPTPNFVPPPTLINENNRMNNGQYIIHQRNLSNPASMMQSVSTPQRRERSLSRGSRTPVQMKTSASASNIHGLNNAMNNMSINNGISQSYNSFNQITPPITPLQHSSHSTPMLANVPPLAQSSYGSYDNQNQHRSFLPGLALGNTAKLKTHFKEDTFTIAVPSTSISYEDLRKKIEKKLRLCCRIPADFNFNQLSIHYKDEAGRHISIKNDDDIFEAFETTYRTFVGKRSSGTMVIELFVQ
ncbi:hypothetical protein BCR36DRAFT_319475 [Piromyces finnis]|uniref:DH domain-containing protein n=1 Tax=Piromyces finnis TaxID=1754191 RepID=A0A1Y1VKB8_9FUNG|nr:hypothetical protein BCR36DRAFT_319475 [Piromyces finnis]|eukprot:ORX57240.1 hypothetical protein BCR36DRAFT_319475 [Piromyces finnis]